MCYNCDDYRLCQVCEGEDHGHNPAHVFLKFRRAQRTDANGQLPRFRAMPSLYPAAMQGCWGFNLETQWFFMTLHCLHVGMLKTCSRYTSLVQGMDSERDSDHRKMESLMKIKLCVDAQLLHPEILAQTLSIYVFLAQWLRRLIDPYGRGPPLQNPPMEWAALPEYLVEDIADFVLFLCRFSLPTIDSTNVLPIINLFISLVRSPPYLCNPYLRAKLVEVFCGLARVQTAHGPGCPSLEPVFTRCPLLVNNMIPALVQLYVDIEHSKGGDSQFYDKFNVRHAVALLMKYLCLHQPHIQQLELQAQNKNLFLKFINSILDDIYYLLEESLNKGKLLKGLQKDNSLHNKTAAMIDSRRAERTRILLNTERSLRTASVLSTHSINLLWLLCSNEVVRSLLLRPELVDRVAQCIGHHTLRLGGAEREELQVMDPSKVSYQPDQWLNRFTDMYLFFSECEPFRLSVVVDGRGFKVDEFRMAVGVLESRSLKTKEETARLLALFLELEQLHKRLELESVKRGEVPEEFLDPILSTMMIDPVVLPSSGITMDRAVITRHLLNENTDPFNRQPLCADDLKPNKELKQQIDDFLRS